MSDETGSFPIVGGDVVDQELPAAEEAADAAAEADDDHVAPDALSGAEDGQAAADEAAGSAVDDEDGSGE